MHAGDADAGRAPVILVVEDERDLADIYADWLRATCDVRVAYDGDGAMDLLDEEVDVALLDRRLPAASGDAILAEIRERGLDCRVAMVTAVEPDFDVVGMGFDDYLVKPVTRADLAETVERLRRLATYDRGIQEHYSLVTKKVMLETRKSDAELDRSAAYAELERELDELRERLDEVRERLDQDDVDVLYRDFDTRVTTQ